ncbi:MAG: SPOR domain-containing protein [Synergistaceae bacterium]|nr:SPOR domain-containing protein [Synergistaceae bacterium]
MTSRPYSERTSRTEPRRSTIRRGIKKRGILPSFGDIILPVVSVAAVVLLIIAGRQFFLNGMRTSPGISSTRAFAESPALMAEREARAERESNSETSNNLIAVSSEDIAASDTNLLAAPGIKETSTPVIVVAEPVKAPENVEPVKPAQTPAKQASPAPVKKEQPKPAKTQDLPASKQWRVQVGAYTLKAAANEGAEKINKAGYKTVVYSNPASKYIKVWVLAGADKKSAEQVMHKMKSMGFKTSFVVPPPKSK